MNKVWKLTEIRFAAGARCRCGAGLAYPIDVTESMELGAWACSRVLLGEIVDAVQHDTYPFAFYEIKSEDQPSAEGRTTRPPGTRVLTRLAAKCRKCAATWSKDPAPPHLAGWSAGPCPKCGEPERCSRGGSNLNIEVRHETVVESL